MACPSVIIQNAKCTIIKACRFDPQVQRSYTECAEGYDFKIDPCPPHDPQKKDLVESGVEYVKGNLLATHPRCQYKGQRVTTPDHLPP